jgi:hypothetical protein
MVVDIFFVPESVPSVTHKVLSVCEYKSVFVALMVKITWRLLLELICVTWAEVLDEIKNKTAGTSSFGFMCLNFKRWNRLQETLEERINQAGYMIRCMKKICWLLQVHSCR